MTARHLVVDAPALSLLRSALLFLLHHMESDANRGRIPPADRQAHATAVCDLYQLLASLDGDAVPSGASRPSAPAVRSH